MRAVLERDLLAQGTRPRAFLVRSIVVAAAAFMVITGLLGSRWSFGQLEPRAFQTASWICLFSLVALTSAAAADSVVEERIRGTLPLVLATLEGPVGFAVGKFLSRAALSFALFAAVLPLLAVCRLFDGGSWTSLLLFSMLASAVILECVGWSVLASTLCRRFESAALLALALPPLRWWATVALGRLLFPGSPGAQWLSTGLTPAPGLLGRGAPPGPCPMGELLGLPEFLRAGPEPIHLAAAFVFAAIAVRASAWLLAREGTWTLPAPRRLRLPLHRAAWRGALQFNPLFAKDLLGARGTASLISVGVAAVALGAWGLHAAAGPGSLPKAPKVHVMILSLSVTASSALAALAGATLLAQERAAGTLPLLRVTRLPISGVLAGKLLAASPPVLLAWAFSVAAAFVAGYTGAFHPGTLLAAFVLATLLPASFGVLGVGWGLAARSPGSALAGVVAALVLSGIGCGWWFMLPALVIARDFWQDRLPGRFLENLAFPCLFLGSPWLVVDGLLGGMEGWIREGSRSRSLGILFVASVVWLVGNVFYVWWGGKDLLRRLREALQQEEDLSSGPTHPFTWKEWKDRRRFEREDRERGVRAPSREWQPVPGTPPESGPGR
jgi:ABC-type transport system involved in multi-copper enzyme maturation permease subunit